tara:strand:+ start:4362 stop:8762 length:4401 start_codon:yes stop_codon:yes gene_type:complete
MDTPILYPSLDNPNFIEEITNHPEFINFMNNSEPINLKKLKKTASINCTSVDQFVYKKIQLFVSHFISLNTPYNSVLLYHGVGVGKTCSSLLITDNFRDYVKKHKKKIYILTKTSVQADYKKELFNSNKEDNKLNKNSFFCLSDKYLDEYNEFLHNNPNITNPKKKFLNSIVNEYYEIYGYTEFTNRFKYIKDFDEITKNKEIHKYFSNSVFVIDEVHNLRDESQELNEDGTKASSKSNKESREFIYDIINSLKEPIKLILLSATPMYDKFDEIQFIINLLLANEKKDSIDLSTIRNYIEDTSNVDLRNTIIEKTRGLISYIKGNDPTIFPKILQPDESIDVTFTDETKRLLTKFNVVPSIMSDYQKKMYLSINNAEKVNKDDLKKKFSNIVFPLKDKDGETTLQNMYKFFELFKKDNNVYSIEDDKEDVVNEFLDNIDKYSAKIHTIINNITSCKGKVFLYSRFVDADNGGSILLSIILEKYGFHKKHYNSKTKQLGVKNMLSTKINENVIGHYIRTDGTTGKDTFDEYIKHFNAEDNINGEQIKIIIGGTNMMEGVSLFNVRECHILDPWYNLSRNEQIVGRAVRSCSHKLLPFNKQNVTVFNHVAITEPIDTISIKENNTYYIKYREHKTNPYDNDIRTIQLACEKNDSIKTIEYLLKRNSIDCELNKSINFLNSIYYKKISEDDKLIPIINSKNNTKFISYNYTDGSIECEYQECDYTCFTEPLEINKYDNIRKSTVFNKLTIKNIKFYIKTIYNRYNKIYFTYDYLYTHSKNYDSSIDEIMFKIALQELVLKKELFYNRFNNLGFITLNGSYFVFKQHTNIKHNIPIEYHTTPYNINFDDIPHSFYTLYNISLNKPTPTKSLFTPFTNTTTNPPGPPKTSTSKKKTLTNMLNTLYDKCIESGIIESLNNDMFKIYSSLYDTFNIKSTKFVVPNMIDNIATFQDFKLLENNLYDILQEFLKFPDIEYPNKNIFLEKYYKISCLIPFIFNYNSIIVEYLKCIFYRKKFIQPSDNTNLNNVETFIYEYYEHLLEYPINSDDPLVFKFINYPKNESEQYLYSRDGPLPPAKSAIPLRFIFYEYNTTTKEWYEHTENFKSNKHEFSSKNKSSKQFISHTLTSANKSLEKIRFIIQHTKINESQLQNIKNTFKYNKYTSHKKGYFIYSGNPAHPYDDHDDFVASKLSNIIGYISTEMTATNENLYNTSRLYYQCGIIYSSIRGNKNIYFKSVISIENTGLKTDGIKQLSQQRLHYMYCLLDEIKELNCTILLKIITKKTDIDDIFNTINETTRLPYKYDFINFLHFDYTTQPIILTKEIYDNLKELLRNLGIDIDELDVINERIQDNMYRLYTYINYIEAIVEKHKSNDGNISKLFLYLLYDLETYNIDISNEHYSFYNKKWLFTLTQSSIFHKGNLGVETMGSSSYDTATTQIIADSTSFTQNILTRKMVFDNSLVNRSLDKDKFI